MRINRFPILAQVNARVSAAGGLCVFLFLGCAQKGKGASAGPPVGADFDGAHAATEGTAARARNDGARDYRGKLGASTSIALHLVCTGAVAGGSYVYTAIGRPIALQGTIDATGAIALTEMVDGKVTGTLRLHPQGDDLVGEWADPAGRKIFPVHLSAVATSQGMADDAGAAASGASERAEECLASPSCPAAAAARLFVAASDENDVNLDCFRFVDGAGTTRDLVRGRTCLEQRAKALECGGSSMFLETAELALMRIDGVGGKADVRGARALLADCFDDAARAPILEHAAAKERDPRTPPVDFCKRIGGTTITSNECAARESTNTQTTGDLRAKAVVVGLDDEGKMLFASSDKAYRDYVTAMGEFVYEVYAQGTIRGLMSLGTEESLQATRAKELADFLQFVAKDTPAANVRRAQRASAAALAEVSADNPDQKQALQKTQHAWAAYRDTEVALYEHVFGPRQGADRVRAALLVHLESRRARECAPPSASGP